MRRPETGGHETCGHGTCGRRTGDRRLAALGAALVSAALAAGAEARAQEGIDAGAPEGAEQTAYTERALDTYALPVAPFGGSGPATREVTGRARWAAFRLTGAAGTEAVIAGYRDRLSARGFRQVFACRTTACGGFDFRFGAQLLPPPGMLIDVQDFAQLTMQRENGGAVSILASQVRDAVYVQTVTVAPEDASPPADITRAPQVETPRETTTLPETARALYNTLQSDGHVKVEGLSFDVGGASLTADSSEILDLLAQMLIRNADLTVAIVGHSDWIGGLEPNIRLSTERARAVMQALIERGVPPARLEARGVGYLAPVQSNQTEAGRALNRRVELVLKP